MASTLCKPKPARASSPGAVAGHCRRKQHRCERKLLFIAAHANAPLLGCASYTSLTACATDDTRLCTSQWLSISEVMSMIQRLRTAVHSCVLLERVGVRRDRSYAIVMHALLGAVFMPQVACISTTEHALLAVCCKTVFSRSHVRWSGPELRIALLCRNLGSGLAHIYFEQSYSVV